MVRFFGVAYSVVGASGATVAVGDADAAGAGDAATGDAVAAGAGFGDMDADDRRLDVMCRQ